MTSKSVHLTGQEHLPPVLRLITDPSYQYSTHRHTIETSNDGTLHSYTVILSREPLDGSALVDDLCKVGKESPGHSLKVKRDGSLRNKSDPLKSSRRSPQPLSAGQLVSQISSTTTSEKRRHSSGRSSMVNSMSNGANSEASSQSSQSSHSSQLTQPTHYFTLPSITTNSQASNEKGGLMAKDSLLTTSNSSNDSLYQNLPKFTYSSGSIKAGRPAKYIVMVHVKFLLLHRDVFKKRIQSTFTDEFPSDCSLEDIIMNFHQICWRQIFRLRGQDFNPRLSYCVGDLNYMNSKPVLKADLKKTLAQLANSNSVGQFALIVDIIDD